MDDEIVFSFLIYDYELIFVCHTPGVQLVVISFGLFPMYCLEYLIGLAFLYVCLLRR